MQTVLDYPAQVTIGGGVMLIAEASSGPWSDTVSIKEVKVKVETEKKEHKGMRAGIARVDKTVVTSIKATGSFICDYPSKENLLLLFQGSANAETQSSGTWGSGTEATPKAYLDKWVSIDDKFDVSSVVVKESGGATLALGTDYLLDADNGLIMVKSDNTQSVADGDTLTITGSYAEHVYNQIFGATQSEIKRHVWFIGDPKSGVIQHLKGYATLSPNAEMGMIGEDFQEFAFDLTFEDNSAYNNSENGLFIYEDHGVSS